MGTSPSFHESYKHGTTPWETGRVDQSLVQFIEQSGLKPCTVLDAGCGTGNNCIWLAEQGFQVTGWDFVEQAVASGRQKARKAGVDCLFSEVDLLKIAPKANTFDFIFDRGLFHCFKSTDQLQEISQIFATLLGKNGLWLSLIGNADETRSETGPPQLSALQIATAVEPLFHIESLTASFFDSDQNPKAKNWVCHMRKR